MGFAQSRYNTSLYYSAVTDVKAMIHGDDFVAVDNRVEIEKFKDQIAARFTVKDQIVGMRSDLGELQETLCLSLSSILVSHTHSLNDSVMLVVRWG